MAFENLFDKDEEIVEIEKEKTEIEKKEIKEIEKPKIPRKPKITSKEIEELINDSLDEDFNKILLVKNILDYTTTEKALHTIGEILKGKSLKRTNKKTLAKEIKNLIDQKILGIIEENKK